jgi:surface antigen
MFAAASVGADAEASSQRQTRKQGAQQQATTQVAQRNPDASKRRPAQRSRQVARAPQRVIPPQDQAFAAVATPAVWRPQDGTPIRHVAVTGGLSCVPFVRMATGMDISGDARAWWYNAAGVYHRGNRPERGSVLAFTASGGMSRGHVAVVSQVVNDRTILIDHSNWGGPGLRRGQVLRNAMVVDVSDRNDWTAVRVQVGWDAGAFGRTYPTHGFIYNRRTDGRTLQASQGRIEVAEAPSPHVVRHMQLATEAFGR